MTAVKVGSTTLGYEIDGLGRRIQNTINGKVKDTYIYSDQLSLAGLVGADGRVLQRYVYATKSHVPDYLIMNGEEYRIITDHLGSVRLVVRVADGSVVQELMHDEFGRVLKSTAPGFQPFGFAGGLYDHNSNLVQFGSRWYDPQFGRWISKDPIKFEGGDNLYAYVLNNPINLIDVNGQSAMRISNEGAALKAGGGGGGGSLALPTVGLIIEALSSRMLTPWEIKNLTDNTGEHPHDIKKGLKPKPSSWDIYVEDDGNLSLRDKNGKNPIPLPWDSEDTKPSEDNQCGNGDGE